MRVLTGVFLAGVAALTMSAAGDAAVLSFTGTGEGTCGPTACVQDQAIAQTYGDTTGINVSYRTVTGFGSTTASATGAAVKWFPNSYANVDNVAIVSPGAVGEITFTSNDSAQLVTLSSFKIATWATSIGPAWVRIYDLSATPTLLWSYDIPSAAGAAIVANQAQVGGLRLQFGAAPSASGKTIAIDDITYSGGGPAQNISAAPEPVTWAMMVGGFGLIGASARRKRARRLAY